METLLPSPAVQPADFIRQHQQELLRFLRLLGCDQNSAEDLAQECFLRVLRQPGRELAGLNSAYLRTVARNLVLDQRRWRRVRAGQVAWDQAVEEELAADPQALSDARLEAMRACFAELGARPRQALEMQHAEGLSQAEIAAVLGLQRDSIKTMLRRARTWLRDCARRRQQEIGA